MAIMTAMYTLDEHGSLRVEGAAAPVLGEVPEDLPPPVPDPDPDPAPALGEDEDEASPDAALPVADVAAPLLLTGSTVADVSVMSAPLLEMTVVKEEVVRLGPPAVLLAGTAMAVARVSSRGTPLLVIRVWKDDKMYD